MFEWLNTIFEWFWDFKPRLELLPPTHGGVKFKPGGKIKELKPGHLYWWWPVTTDVTTIGTKRQSIEVQQELTTKDEISVMVKTVIVFTIDDVIKALVDTDDIDDTTDEMGKKGTVAAVTSRDFGELVTLTAQHTDLRNEVTAGARSALHPFGVKVKDAFISSFGETRIYSIMGDGGAVPVAEDEDD